MEESLTYCIAILFKTSAWFSDTKNPIKFGDMYVSNLSDSVISALWISTTCFKERTKCWTESSGAYKLNQFQLEH